MYFPGLLMGELRCFGVTQQQRHAKTRTNQFSLQIASRTPLESDAPRAVWAWRGRRRSTGGRRTCGRWGAACWRWARSSRCSALGEEQRQRREGAFGARGRGVGGQVEGGKQGSVRREGRGSRMGG